LRLIVVQQPSAPLYPNLSVPISSPFSVQANSTAAGPVTGRPHGAPLWAQRQLEKAQCRRMKWEQWKQERAERNSEKEEKKEVKFDRKQEKDERKQRRCLGHGKCMRNTDSNAQKLVARFVKDMGDVQDGIEMSPGTKFVKTWRFRNEGSTAWPEGCTLVFLSKRNGDQMGGPTSVPVISVPAGGEADVSVELVAPTSNGRFVGHYRLLAPSGMKFGDRVRNLIYVCSSSSSSDEDMTQVAPTSIGLASITSIQLEQMGFMDKALNEKMIRKFGSQTNKIITKLVHKQHKSQRRVRRD